MYEVYVRCPATGEPFYAGVQDETRRGADLPSFLQNSVCPVCGVKHEWRASSVMLEVPLAGPAYPAYETPAYDGAASALQTPIIPDPPVEEWAFERAVGAE